MAYALPFLYKERIALSKKRSFVEIHKFTVIEDLGEIYPETGQKLIRPKVNIVRAVLLTVLVIVGAGLLSWGILSLLALFPWYQQFKMPWGWQFTLLYIALLLLSVWICAKRIVIFVIRVYQRYGPYHVRCKCLFIPNCSEYMILAIKKYGLIRGIRRGIKRMHRCVPPNGGEDYP